MNNPVPLLDQVVSDLDQVLSADALASLSDADRMHVLRIAGEAFRRIEAVVVETTAGAEPGFPEEFGCRNMNELLQRVLRVDAPGAARVVKAADLLHRDVELTSGARLPAQWPALRGAMLDGTIGIAGLLAATGPIERAGVRIGAADRLRADAELAGQARGYVLADADADFGERADADTVPADVAPPATPEDLKQFAQLIALYLDPDGSAPSEAEASQNRSFTVGRLRNGTYPVRGNMLPEVYAQMQLIFDAQLNPKTDGPADLGVMFRPSDEIDGHDDGADGADPFNSDPRNVIDPRTRAQKQHDALAAALGIAARHDDMPSSAARHRLSSCTSTLRTSPRAPVRSSQSDQPQTRSLCRTAAPTPTAASTATPAPERDSRPVGRRSPALTPRSRHPSPPTPPARVRSNASCSTRAASSGSASPTGSSPSTNAARSCSATKNASSRAATSRHPGARSTT